MTLTKCRSCGASIFWARGKNGKQLPIDAETVPGGNITIEDDPQKGLVAHVHGKPSGEHAYVSHFATCPQAGKWRKP